MDRLAEFRESEAGKWSGALLALWWAGRGDWDRAHQAAQEIEGRDGAWVHAYLHRMEGDTANAGYWYRRAGNPPPQVRSSRSGPPSLSSCCRATDPPPEQQPGERRICRFVIPPAKCKVSASGTGWRLRANVSRVVSCVGGPLLLRARRRSSVSVADVLSISSSGWSGPCVVLPSRFGCCGCWSSVRERAFVVRPR